jgi:hypothetical protein
MVVTGCVLGIEKRRSANGLESLGKINLLIQRIGLWRLI